MQQLATSTCFTPCTTTSGQLPFSISVPYTAAVIAADGTVTTPSVQVTGVGQILPGNCNNDYLVIAGGFSPVTNLINNFVLDRFCGERFTTGLGSTVSSTVCSKWSLLLKCLLTGSCITIVNLQFHSHRLAVQYAIPHKRRRNYHAHGRRPWVR